MGEGEREEESAGAIKPAQCSKCTARDSASQKFFVAVTTTAILKYHSAGIF
jgi:hypothetical protein